MTAGSGPNPIWVSWSQQGYESSTHQPPKREQDQAQGPEALSALSASKCPQLVPTKGEHRGWGKGEQGGNG